MRHLIHPVIGPAYIIAADLYSGGDTPSYTEAIVGPAWTRSHPGRYQIQFASQRPDNVWVALPNESWDEFVQAVNNEGTYVRLREPLPSVPPEEYQAVQFHNPLNLTPEQVGEGWRLLTVEEAVVGPIQPDDLECSQTPDYYRGRAQWSPSGRAGQSFRGPATRCYRTRQPLPAGTVAPTPSDQTPWQQLVALRPEVATPQPPQPWDWRDQVRTASQYMLTYSGKGTSNRNIRGTYYPVVIAALIVAQRIEGNCPTRLSPKVDALLATTQARQLLNEILNAIPDTQASTPAQDNNLYRLLCA
jgi:hypothetical protein